MDALADNELATAAIQHGEVPYHFRGFGVNETTVISPIQKAEIAELSGFPAGFQRLVRAELPRGEHQAQGFPAHRRSSRRGGREPEGRLRNPRIM